MSLPNYKQNDPLGWCGDPKRGAAMGRPCIHNKPKDFTGVIHLRKVRLSGDYDVNGTYFGARMPGHSLYWYATIDLEIDACVDATSREQARMKVLAHYPLAKVRR